MCRPPPGSVGPAAWWRPRARPGVRGRAGFGGVLRRGGVDHVDVRGAGRREVGGVAERLCTRPLMLAVQDDAAAPVAIVGEATPDMAPDDARWSVPPVVFR